MKKVYEVAEVKVVLLTDASIDCLTSSVESIDGNADGYWTDGWE